MAKPVKNLASFRAAHDESIIIPNKIRAALESLAKEHGAEGWEYENEFLKRVSCSTTQLAAYRDGFSSYIVETSGSRSKRVWFATEKAAKAVRQS